MHEEVRDNLNLKRKYSEFNIFRLEVSSWSSHKCIGETWNSTKAALLVPEILTVLHSLPLPDIFQRGGSVDIFRCWTDIYVGLKDKSDSSSSWSGQWDFDFFFHLSSLFCLFCCSWDQAGTVRNNFQANNVPRLTASQLQHILSGFVS